jgi:peptidoglycan hydrolase CwlO-like protein
MRGVIKTLKRDLQDHQEVEKELAKRSHFCQKVIKKYKEQITQLKEDIQREKQS